MQSCNIILFVLKAGKSHRSHVFTFLVLPPLAMVSLPREGSCCNTLTAVYERGLSLRNILKVCRGNLILFSLHEFSFLLFNTTPTKNRNLIL